MITRRIRQAAHIDAPNLPKHLPPLITPRILPRLAHVDALNVPKYLPVLTMHRIHRLAHIDVLNVPRQLLIPITHRILQLAHVNAKQLHLNRCRPHVPCTPDMPVTLLLTLYLRVWLMTLMVVLQLARKKVKW